MNDGAGAGSAIWTDAVLAATLLSVDTGGLGGIRLRARAGPVRERWLALLRRLWDGRPMPRLPLHAQAEALGGGLDLAATLRAGRPVREAGLLERADGGVLLIPMAERIEPQQAAAVALALETGRAHGEVLSEAPCGDAARFGVVALDEGAAPDEHIQAGLAERLALHVDLTAVTVRDLDAADCDGAVVEAARGRLDGTRAGDDALEVLCTASAALGIASMRAPLLALRAARASAALDGRIEVGEGDIAAAVRLVLAPRATTMPAGEESGDAPEPPNEDETPEPADPADDEQRADDPESADAGDDRRDSDRDDVDEPAPVSPEELAEQILEAAQARIPEGLLDESRGARAGSGPRGQGGKAGAVQRTGRRGRPAGVRRGRPGPHARLNLIETLRAAAPWQKLRGGEPVSDGGPRVQVRQDDFRVTRYKQRRETTTVFVVDASGSAALHRLAEAKGAVELLLADCYVRRDRVALVTFRGTGSEVLLPPTRSLVQAKRRLAELPGGGGTPLAAGLDHALELGDAITRRGATPIIVVLTDGRANIAADGTPGRERAHADALAAGRRLRAASLTVLLVDTSPRPRPLAEELAAAMGARYLPLPQADAAHLSAAVKAQAA